VTLLFGSPAAQQKYFTGPAVGAGLRLYVGQIYRDGTSSDNPTFLVQRERVYQGMRLAGVPEG
jgi:hypothetical protein